MGGCVCGLKTQLAMTQLSFNLGQLSKEVQKLEHAKLDTWGLKREISFVFAWIVKRNLKIKLLFDILKSWDIILHWWPNPGYNIEKRSFKCFPILGSAFGTSFPALWICKAHPHSQDYSTRPSSPTTHRSQEAKCQQSKMCPPAACLNYLTKKIQLHSKKIYLHV